MRARRAERETKVQVAPRKKKWLLRATLVEKTSRTLPKVVERIRKKGQVASKKRRTRSLAAVEAAKAYSAGSTISNMKQEMGMEACSNFPPQDVEEGEEHAYNLQP